MPETESESEQACAGSQAEGELAEQCAGEESRVAGDGSWVVGAQTVVDVESESSESSDNSASDSGVGETYQGEEAKRLCGSSERQAVD